MRPLELPGWKTALSWMAAILVSVLFLISGVWKITDVEGAAMRMAQARVPESLSLLAALAFGIAETVGAVLILVPRFRRWGSILVGLLLVAFVAYMVANYGPLRGADCSCFPWVKRLVGPGFFIGDGLMLALAALAGIWSQPPASARSAVMILGAVAVFAGVSYGVEIARQTGTRAPDSITVDGRQYSLDRGRVFVFFFDPECTHCFEVSRRMSHFQWGDTKVIVVPVEQPQFAGMFLDQSGLKAGVTPEFTRLKQVFGYKVYPFGVALQNGREKAALTRFDVPEPDATLKRLGFIY